MTKKPSIVANVLWNWGTFFSGLAVMFIMTPIMLHELDQTLFGIWNLVLSVMSYFELMEFGIRTALVRTIAERMARKDIEGTNTYCSTAMVFFIAVGLGIILCGQVVALLAQDLFKLDPANVSLTRDIIRVYSLAQGLQFPFNAYTASLIGMQRYDVTNKTHIAITVMRTLMAYFALKAHWGLMAIVFIHSGMSLLSFLINARQAKAIIPGFAPSPFRADKKTFRQLFRFGGGILTINVSSRVVEAAGPTLAGMLLSMKDVASLSISYAFSRYLAGFITSGIRVVIPHVGALSGGSSQEDITGKIGTASRVSMIMTLIASGIYGCGICLFGNDFLIIWLGEDMASSVTPLLPAVMAYSVVSQASNCLLNVFLGMGKLHRIPHIHGLETAATIVLSFVFAKAYGAKGLPLACLACLTVVRMPIYIYYFVKLFGAPLALDMLLRTAYLASAFFAGTYCTAYLKQWFPLDSFVTIFGAAAVYSVVMIALTIWSVPGIGGITLRLVRKVYALKWVSS